MRKAFIEKTDFGLIIRVPDELRQSPLNLMKEVNNLILEIEVSKVNRILYEINEPTTKLNGAQLVQIANSLAEKLSNDLKIAIYSPQYNYHLTSFFIENLIQSKKIPAKYFNDFTQAVSWLKE